MNLNRLYPHDSPSQQSEHAAPPPVNQGQTHAEQLRQTQAHAEHWRNETVRMDQIARDAVSKLESKRLKIQKLKSTRDAIREEADKWQARYREVCTAQTEILSREKDAKDKLRELEEQLPGVQERLEKGGAAFLRIRELEPLYQQLVKAKAADEAKIMNMEPELKRLMKAKAIDEEKIQRLEATVKQMEKSKDGIQRRGEVPTSSTSDHDAAALREKLRTATQQASASASRATATRDMLARAEQVLLTCLQLHVANSGSSELAAALEQTTQNIAAFLKKTPC
jgi:chromosome segregation ATPase